MCDGKIYLYNAKLNIAREESVRIFHCSRALLRFNSRWDSIVPAGGYAIVLEVTLKFGLPVYDG